MSFKRWQTAAEIKAHRKAEAKYQKSPEQIQKRENRNEARQTLERQGKVSKGDGKDVEHKDGNALNNDKTNWLVGSRHHNRSYARTKTAGKKDPTS